MDPTLPDRPSDPRARPAARWGEAVAAPDPSRCGKGALLFAVSVAAALGPGCITPGGSARHRLDAERHAILARAGDAPSGAPHAVITIPEGTLQALVGAAWGAGGGAPHRTDLSLPGGISAGFTAALDRRSPVVRLSQACDACVHFEQPIAGSLGLDLKGPFALGGQVGLTGAVGADFVLRPVVDRDTVTLVSRVVGEPSVRLSFDLGPANGVMRPVLEATGREWLGSWARGALPRDDVVIASFPRGPAGLHGIRLETARVVVSRDPPALQIHLWTDAPLARPGTLAPGAVTAPSGSLAIAIDEAALEGLAQRRTAESPPGFAAGAGAALARSVACQGGELIVQARLFLLPGRGAEWDATAWLVPRVLDDTVRVLIREIRLEQATGPPLGLAPSEADLDALRTRMQMDVPRVLRAGDGPDAPRLRVDGVAAQDGQLRVVLTPL